MSKYYNETCLFSGRVSGNFTLSDSPMNYDAIRILYCSKDVKSGTNLKNGFPTNWSPVYSCDISTWQNSGFVVLNNPFYATRQTNNSFSAVYDSVAAWSGANTTAWKIYNNSFSTRSNSATSKGEPWTWVRGIYGINYGVYGGFRKEIIYSGTDSNIPSYNTTGNIVLTKNPLQYERLGICYGDRANSNNIPMYTEIQTDILKDTSGYMMLQGFYSDQANMQDNLSNMTPWSGCTGTTWTRYPGTWYKNTNTAATGVGRPWIYTIFGIGEK